jgi:hypothetical protein
MDDEGRPDFSATIKDNETAAAQSFEDGNFLQAYLLIHSLIESLLRFFLRIPEGQVVTFDGLVQKYGAYLKRQEYPTLDFVDDLTNFNRRRNRIVHHLWHKGYSLVNKQSEGAAHASVILYGLFVEWLETFDPEITQIGFHYEKGV